MKKIKNYAAAHQKQIAFGAVLFFVASLSFGLGYAAFQQFDHASIIIEKCASSS